MNRTWRYVCSSGCILQRSTEAGYGWTQLFWSFPFKYEVKVWQSPWPRCKLKINKTLSFYIIIKNNPYKRRLGKSLTDVFAESSALWERSEKLEALLWRNYRKRRGGGREEKKSIRSRVHGGQKRGAAQVGKSSTDTFHQMLTGQAKEKREKNLTGRRGTFLGGRVFFKPRAGLKQSWGERR